MQRPLLLLLSLALLGGCGDDESTSSRAPAPVEQPSEPESIVEQEEVPPDLDIELAPGPGDESMRLLPPLFEGGGPSRSMQIGGRLISGEAEDEELIEGAEIRLEFKR